MLDLAIAGSDHLMVLINDLMEVGTLEAGEMQFAITRENLLPILKNSVELNQPYGEKYKVEFVLDETLDVQVRVDATRFTQVISNLLSNAAKFSPPGSKVEITSRRNRQQSADFRDRSWQGHSGEFSQPHFPEICSRAQQRRQLGPGPQHHQGDGGAHVRAYLVSTPNWAREPPSMSSCRRCSNSYSTASTSSSASLNSITSPTIAPNSARPSGEA